MRHATVLQGHTTEYHLHGVIIGTVLRFSWSVSEARKQSSRRKRCLCTRKGLQVMDNGHLKNMAKLRFAFLTVNVRIVILCGAAACSVQRCTVSSCCFYHQKPDWWTASASPIF